MSLSVSMVTIYIGIFYLTSKKTSDLDFDKNKDFALNPASEMILFCIILLSNAVFVIMWMFQFYFIIKVMFRDKYPKLYVALCLCCRIDKLERESSAFA